MRVDETCDSVDDVDVIPRELVANDVDLALDDVAGPEPEILDGDVFLEPVAVSVDGSLADPGEVDDRLAEGLRRDRPAVYGDAADRPPRRPSFAAWMAAFCPAGPEPMARRS